MAKTDPTGPGCVLQDTADAHIREIEKLVPSAGGDRTLGFWHVGEKLCQIREDGTDNPVAEVSGKTHLSARQLRYCAEVREAFEYARLEALVKLKLRWSTVKILASDCLAPHRDQLITDFESGRLSNAQLLAEAITLRGRIMRTERADGDGGSRERRLQRLAARVVSQSARLRKDLVAAGKRLQGGAEGTGAGKQIRAMNEALQGLVEEAQGLLRQSGALAGEKCVPGSGLG